MHIQTSMDNNIDRHEALAKYVNAIVVQALDHSSDHITRMAVHLSDENASKSGQDDKRCVMVARPVRLLLVAVTEHAASLHQAIAGAARKLARLIEGLHTQSVRRDDVAPLALLSPLEPEA